jgi:DNA modification methylase
MGIFVYFVYKPLYPYEFQRVTTKHKSFTLGGFVYNCFFAVFGVELTENTTDTMQIRTIKLTAIKPNPNNPRTIKDEKFKKLVKSIQDFPKMLEIRPIVVNSDMIVLGGNMRLKACKEAGLKEVPIVLADDLTEDEQKQFIIKDNVGFGDWDWGQLGSQWDTEELQAWGLDVPDMHVETLEAVEDDFDAEPPSEPKTALGDLYEIGPHRLLCGDSTDSDQVANLMNGEKADMVFTDPPYGVSYVGKTKDALKIESDDCSPEKLKEFVTAWFSNVDLVTREGAYLLATVPAGPLHLIFANDWLERGWLRQIMVWNKSSMVLGHGEYHYKHEPILFGWKQGGQRLKNSDRTKTTVWDFDKPSANREHPTMKPIKMWEYGINNHTIAGDLLFEPFLGSGSTMVAAHQLKRKCYGMELDPKYCDVIINRMLKLDPSLTVKRNGVDVTNDWR